MWFIIWTTYIIKWMNQKMQFCLYLETEGEYEKDLLVLLLIFLSHISNSIWLLYHFIRLVLKNILKILRLNGCICNSFFTILLINVNWTWNTRYAKTHTSNIPTTYAKLVEIFFTVLVFFLPLITYVYPLNYQTNLWLLSYVLVHEICCWHIWFGWKTHVKDGNVPRQLTVEEWKNRLQLTPEENLGS